jgi:uncharacterized protein Yka (UPF0111/DUF47 family)
MFGSSSKHDKIFFDHFEQEMKCSTEAARLLVRCLEGGAAPDQVRSDITGLLEKSTKLDREVQAEARKTWITPFDGWDIRELSLRFSVLMRHIEAGAERVAAYGLCNEKGKTPSEALELAGYVVKACEQLEEAVQNLSKKRADDEILKRVEEVHNLERQSDQLYRRALTALFDGHSPAPMYDRPVSSQNRAENGHTNGHSNGESLQAVFAIIKWHELYDKLEQASNACRDVANEIQSIVAEHA